MRLRTASELKSTVFCEEFQTLTIYTLCCWQISPDFSAMREMKSLRVYCINYRRGCRLQPFFGKLKVFSFYFILWIFFSIKTKTNDAM